MTAEQQAPEPDVEYVEVQPEVRNYRGQAVYDAARRERKARAAVTVEANAKAAAKAKRKALAKAPSQPGVADFNKRAKAIEAEINKSKSEDTK